MNNNKLISGGGGGVKRNTLLKNFLQYIASMYNLKLCSLGSSTITCVTSELCSSVSFVKF